MKKTSWFFLFAFIIVAAAGCKHENDNSPSTTLDYFIFGHFFGECGGEQCVETFVIQDEKLYEDTLDDYPGIADFEDRQLVLLDNSIYNLVAGLPDQMPDELWDETETTIGMPDAGDWGGIYVEVKRDGETRYWLIDHMDNNIPEYLHPFTDAIKEAIEEINE
ncbi:MAG: hypothetical protein IPN33_03575 [Saprospiraceae bacterium]|nr:hypothetical protein [Saprospiraceae bacterium]